MQVTKIEATSQKKAITRYAAYARVSRHTEEQLLSFASQLRYYSNMFKESENSILIELYADEGITGTDLNKRDDFKRMLADARLHKFDRIICKSVTRFARNTKDCLSAIRELKSLGISVYFEENRIDTQNLAGEALITLLGLSAQNESMSISKNERWSIRNRMANGTYVSYHAPFGYKFEGKEMKISEENAEIVKRIFRDFLNGKSIMQISKELDAETDEKWGYARVRVILMNEKYTGDSLFQKNYTTDTLPFVVKKNKGELNYCNRRVQENIRDSYTSVDVTNWYRIEDIYKARINYFSQNHYICDEDFDKIRDIVDIIIKDSKKGKRRASGAMDMLERMYNFDKRSLQSNLLTAISQIVLSSDGGILKDKFIELYNDMGPMVYDPNIQGHRFRYLCRRAVIRILLNRIEIENRDTFFDGIYFSQYGNECKQSSYMRKMLIFLMHNQVVDNKIIDNYVSFDSVINAIARPSCNSNITESSLEEIIRLIYKLSDYKLHNSAWQQLISIKFNYPDKHILIDEDSFVLKIKELYKNQKLSDIDFGVKLNYAGVFLAYIQSDFEFFACRCKDFRIPLIFTKDVNYIKSLLDEVHSKAVNCIKMVIEDEKTIFGSYKEMYLENKKYLYKDDVSQERLLPHPKRIINNHIMYLEHYKYFVKEVDGIFSREDKSIIIEKVEQIINKYKSNYNDLVVGYGCEDGDFAGTMFLKDFYNIPYFWEDSLI